MITHTSPAGSEAAPATPARWEHLTVPVVAVGFGYVAGAGGYRGVLRVYSGLGWELTGIAGYPGGPVEGTIVVLFFTRPVG